MILDDFHGKIIELNRDFPASHILLPEGMAIRMGNKMTKELEVDQRANHHCQRKPFSSYLKKFPKEIFVFFLGG